MTFPGNTLDYSNIRWVPTVQNGTVNPHFFEYLVGQTDSSDFEFEHLTDLEWLPKILLSTLPLGLLLGAIYLGGVFYLQHFMKNRKAVELKEVLVAWNIFVGLFSIIGFWRSAPELLKFVGKPNGFYESICVPNYTLRFIYWEFLFGASKLPELIDTVFVVLRKKPLEGVQWFHHLATMLGFWTLVPYFEPVSRYIVVINFGVHSLVYPYFALKVAGVKVPRFLAKIITSCQFTQMIIMLCVNLTSAYFYFSGSTFCHRHPLSLCYNLCVGLTFVAMFGNLFVQIVFQPRRVGGTRKNN